MAVGRSATYPAFSLDYSHSNMPRYDNAPETTANG